LYTPPIDVYGFGSFFVLQTLFSMFIFIDLTQDANRYTKVLSVAVDPRMSNVKIPFSWILFFGACFEFLASFFMILTTNTVYKRFNALKMSSEHQWRLNFMKHTFVLVTVLMFALILLYWNFSENYSGTMKIVILVVMIAIVGLSTADLLYANHFTQLITTSTDG
jgi:hypothetical protein